LDQLASVLLAPLFFVLPGLLPARIITGGAWNGWTLAWSIFFSVVGLPPLAFGLAMLLGTTVNLFLLIPLAAGLGALNLIFPKPMKSFRSNAGAGTV